MNHHQLSFDYLHPPMLLLLMMHSQTTRTGLIDPGCCCYGRKCQRTTTTTTITRQPVESMTFPGMQTRGEQGYCRMKIEKFPWPHHCTVPLDGGVGGGRGWPYSSFIN